MEEGLLGEGRAVEGRVEKREESSKGKAATGGEMGEVGADTLSEKRFLRGGGASDTAAAVIGGSGGGGRGSGRRRGYSAEGGLEGAGGALGGSIEVVLWEYGRFVRAETRNAAGRKAAGRKAVGRNATVLRKVLHNGMCEASKRERREERGRGREEDEEKQRDNKRRRKTPATYRVSSLN